MKVIMSCVLHNRQHILNDSPFLWPFLQLCTQLVMSLFNRSISEWYRSNISATVFCEPNWISLKGYFSTLSCGNFWYLWYLNVLNVLFIYLPVSIVPYEEMCALCTHICYMHQHILWCIILCLLVLCKISKLYILIYCGTEIKLVSPSFCLG